MLRHLIYIAEGTKGRVVVFAALSKHINNGDHQRRSQGRIREGSGVRIPRKVLIPSPLHLNSPPLNKLQYSYISCSYEGNKAVAKDSNASAGTRVSAAADAVGDKVNEMGHASSKEAHKQNATH